MSQRRPGPWQQELEDFTRAFSGAFLFGIPLLYTMEMWWIGMYADMWKLLVFLAIAFVADLGLNYFTGFRREKHSRWQAINQAVDVVAVGVVASTAVLFVLNRISLTDPLDSTLGKIIIQAVPLSIGASVANAIFGNPRGGRQGGGQQEDHPWHALLNDLAATAIGSVFVTSAIAPTEEIPMLAAALDYPHLLALIGLSLLVGYAIVFASGFDTQQHSPGVFQHPLTETALAYAVSLLLALVTLYLFNRIEWGDPLPSVVAQTLVLGLPATIGGAAGRLAI